MDEFFRQVVHQEKRLPPGELLLLLAVAFGMGCIAAGIHQLIAVRGARRTDRSFLATLVLLSVLIALVMLVIGDNLARAFSLTAALAIIRFRTVVEDTRDTAFVIYAVVSGMAVGTGHLYEPVLCAPLVLLAAFVLRPRNVEAAPLEGKIQLRLSAVVPGDEKGERSPINRVEQVLAKHLRSYRLSALGTARGGSAFDAAYTIRMPSPGTVISMITELSRLDGIQSVELKEG